MEQIIDLPDLHINGDEVEKGILTLMGKIEPSWPNSGIVIKEMAFGNQSCHLSKCYLDTNPEKAYVIRVFSAKPHSMKNYTFEIKALKVLSTYENFTKLAAIFENGVCYHYTEGSSFCYEVPNMGISKSVIIDDEKLKLIAERLVTIHRIKIPHEDYTKSVYFDNLMKVVDQTYPDDAGEFPPRSVLKDIVLDLRKGIEELSLPIVFCHGDYQLTNILWNEKTKTVIPIDWEMAHIGYRAWDVAYILEKFQVLCTLFDYKSYLPEDYRNKFLRFYFAYDCELNEKPVDEVEFQKFVKEFEIFKVVASVFYLTVSVDALMKIPNAPESYNQYILQWMDHFIKNKERVIKEYPK